MSLRIDDIAPNFAAETAHGTTRFHRWIGDGRAVLFSHPNEEADKIFPGYKTAKPYLRTTVQPQ